LDRAEVTPDREYTVMLLVLLRPSCNSIGSPPTIVQFYWFSSDHRAILLALLRPSCNSIGSPPTIVQFYWFSSDHRAMLLAHRFHTVSRFRTAYAASVMYMSALPSTFAWVGAYEYEYAYVHAIVDGRADIYITDAAYAVLNRDTVWKR
jgi:hypothetical protein